MAAASDATPSLSDDAAFGVPTSTEAGEGEEEAWGEEELWGEADEADGEHEAAAAAASAPPLPPGNGPAAGSSEPHAHVVYPIRVDYLGGRFLVWEPREIYALRVDHRLVGSLVGAISKAAHGRQAHEGGPPLALAYEEALLAAEEGIITVVDFNEPEPAADADAAAGASDAAATAGSSDAAADDAEPPERVVPLEEIRLLRPERLMYAKVFRDLWTQGHYVTMGARFGGDFLAYAGDPMRVHAHLIVHVIPSASEMVATELVACARLANTAKKTAALAIVDPQNMTVAYLSVAPLKAQGTSLPPAAPGSAAAAAPGSAKKRQKRERAPRQREPSSKE